MNLFDIKTAAGILEVSEQEIEEMLKEGELSGREACGKWMISERQIREYLNQKENEKFSLHYGL